MFNKTIVLTLLTCLFCSSVADAKRGGHRRSYHRSHTYHYKNNEESKLRTCSGRYVDYYGVCDEKNMENSESPKPVTTKKKIQKVSGKASKVETSLSDSQVRTVYPQEKPKPTCAPLYMAHKPGYTNLPICVDGQY
ncbi:hypothetical protein [Escherichia albertii]|uniref:hypothetical protein n=1 Tax=Escherichia albertii TaxID=208962 RepID=UPI0020179511|nr:hypothetical protein [Escherichia albertii]MDD9754443.1 hypothetical protein [Escherichia albertii]